MKWYVIQVSLGLSLIGCIHRYPSPDNTKPMYGEIPKSADYQMVDEEFIDTAMKEFTSREEAAKFYVARAWQHVWQDSLDIAMKRFNQAWLLDPRNPDCFWGFGVLTERKGNDTEAVRFLDLGLALDSTHVGINTEMATYFANKALTEKGPQAISDANEAVAYMERVVRHHPEDTASYVTLATANYYAGHLYDAWTAVHKYESLAGNPIDQNLRHALELAMRDPLQSP